MIRGKKERNSHNVINKMSTSKIQAQGDMGFLWADTGDDMAKTM